MTPMQEPDPSYSFKRNRLTDGRLWRRGLVMAVILVLFAVARWLLVLAAAVQFLWVLFAGRRNEDLVRFGADLGRWTAGAAEFLTFASEAPPFPWRRWGA